MDTKMKFTKNKGLSLIAAFIVLVVFNVIAFVIPFSKHEGFWVGYSFGTLAILLTTAVGLFALGHEGMKSKFYGMPLVSVAWTYLVVQLIVSFIEMAAPFDFYRYEIVLNVIILALCLVGLLGVAVGKGEVERIDEKVKEKVFYIKALQSDVEGLIARVSEESAKKMVKDLAEAFKYSDPMSSPQLAAVENKIEARVAVLAANIADANAVKELCDEVQQLLAERNRKCKILK